MNYLVLGALIACSSPLLGFIPGVHQQKQPDAVPADRAAASSRSANQAQEERQCVACLEPFDGKKRVSVSFDCKGRTENSTRHELCQACTLEQIKVNRRCPLCRDTLRLTKDLRLHKGEVRSKEFKYKDLPARTKAELLEVIKVLGDPDQAAKAAHLKDPDSKLRTGRGHNAPVGAARPGRRSPAEMVAGTGRRPFKQLSTEFLCALGIGMLMSNELKTNISGQEKRALEQIRTLYGPLLVLPNILLTSYDMGRLYDWRTYALWSTGLLGGAILGRYTAPC